MYASIAASIRSNLQMLLILCTIGAIIAGVLRYTFGGGHHLGDLTALLAMIAGRFMMVRSEGVTSPSSAIAA